jgi:hypothetical protein
MLLLLHGVAAVLHCAAASLHGCAAAVASTWLHRTAKGSPENC